MDCLDRSKASCIADGGCRMNANWMGQIGGDGRMPTFYSEVVCDGCRKHRLLFRVNQFSLCLECKIEFEENGHEAFWLKNSYYIYISRK